MTTVPLDIVDMKTYPSSPSPPCSEQQDPDPFSNFPLLAGYHYTKFPLLKCLAGRGHDVVFFQVNYAINQLRKQRLKAISSLEVIKVSKHNLDVTAEELHTAGGTESEHTKQCSAGLGAMIADLERDLVQLNEEIRNLVLQWSEAYPYFELTLLIE